MIAWLGSILCTTSNEYASIICLDWAESNGNVEVDVEHLPLLSLVIDVIKGHNLLVKFEEVDLVGSCRFKLLLVRLILWSIDHSDACLCKIVGHCKLRVPIEADILLMLASVVALIASTIGRFEAAMWSSPTSTSGIISMRICRVCGSHSIVLSRHWTKGSWDCLTCGSLQT